MNTEKKGTKKVLLKGVLYIRRGEEGSACHFIRAHAYLQNIIIMKVPVI
jgi:hypothetical protein